MFNWRVQRGKTGTPLFLPQVTPLFAACMGEAWDIALLLLSKGADPNKAATNEDGDVVTSLHIAAASGSIDMCKSLLASGARQDIYTGGGVGCCDFTYFHILMILQHANSPLLDVRKGS